MSFQVACTCRGHLYQTSLSQGKRQLRQSANQVLCFHEQIWDFASPDSRQPSFNFGMGANFDLDTNQLTAKCRFKSDQVGLLLLPEPALELRGKWRVFDSPLAVDVKYQCPVTNFTKFWESPAKVRVRFFNANHAGLHITPGGKGIAASPCGHVYSPELLPARQHVFLQLNVLLDELFSAFWMPLPHVSGSIFRKFLSWDSCHDGLLECSKPRERCLPYFESLLAP